MTFTELTALGYLEPRLLPTGETAALQRFAFTVGIVTGIEEFSYRCRWCFESYAEASMALRVWDGRGSPPGAWIKQKGRTESGAVVDRGNPEHPTPFVAQRAETLMSRCKMPYSQALMLAMDEAYGELRT